MGLFNFLFGSEDDVNKYKTNPAAGENAYFQWRLYDDFKNYQTPELMKKLILNEYNYARHMFEENYNIRKVSASSNIPRRILDIMQRCIYATEVLPLIDYSSDIVNNCMADYYGSQKIIYSIDSDGTLKMYRGLSNGMDEMWNIKIKIPEPISIKCYPWRIDPEGNCHQRYEFSITTGSISREIVKVNHCWDDSQVWWSHREAYNKPTNYLSLFGLNY